MVFNTQNLEQHLMETAAGHAVFDSLVQANVDPNTVPVETVKEMLLAECRFQARTAQRASGRLMFA